MASILSPVFNILTGEVAICGNALYNYLILLIVGEIAFRCAYNLVGDAYHSGIINGRTTGSILHWGIRLLIYVAAAYVLRAGIWVYNFIIGIPSWFWWTFLAICCLAIIIAIRLFVSKKQKATTNN